MVFKYNNVFNVSTGITEISTKFDTGAVNIMPKFLSLLIVLLSNLIHAQILEETRLLVTDERQNSIRTRFQLPTGYHWKEEADGSFADFLQYFPMHPAGFPARDHRGRILQTHAANAGLLRIDTGSRDLQQCADAWIRLYAEHLYHSGRRAEISFAFTSGQRLSLQEYLNGTRTVETGKRVQFINTPSILDTYENFRYYLDLVFQYAGTISLYQDSQPVPAETEIEAGDFIIKPGSPGHLVIIMAVAEDTQGKRKYLLAESFMPAQDIRILKNPRIETDSPWYEIGLSAKEMETERYTFSPIEIRRYVLAE